MGYKICSSLIIFVVYFELKLLMKLETVFSIVFVACVTRILIVEDTNKIYNDKTLCILYRNNVLMSSIIYHLITGIISIINKEWVNIYILIFCLVFGIFQTFIPDNYLCVNKLMEYPLNKYQISNILGYCIPEYMIFSWSLFAFLEIKIIYWISFNKNKLKNIMISTLFGYILIISMEILTNYPTINIIALWKANTQHLNVNLVIGGLPFYLIIPEFCLCLILAIVYHLIINKLINKHLNIFEFIFYSIIYSLLVTIIYILLIKSICLVFYS